MNDFAILIAERNLDYIKTITMIPWETLKANLNWVVYRNSDTYYEWRIVPAREFKAICPGVTPENP